MTMKIEERERLFRQYEKLVDFVLVKQLHIYSVNGIYEDARQQGYLKLLHCIDVYDWNNAEYKFTTFATTALYRHLRLYITSERLGIKICSQDLVDIRHIAESDKLGVETGLSSKRESYVRKLFRDKLSLDSFIDSDDFESVYMQIEEESQPIKEYNGYTTIMTLVEEYKRGKSKSICDVVDAYCNRILLNMEDCTMSAVAEDVGLTRQRVSIIINNFKKSMQLKLHKTGVYC